MKVNTHGLKMVGLKAAAGTTEDRYDGCYVQISYDMTDGEILTAFHTQNNWSQYNNESIITVANTSNKMTMQEIADAIKTAVDETKLYA